MPICISKTTTWSFKLGDSPVWKVSDDCVKVIAGENFVKLLTRDIGLLTMIGHGCVVLTYQKPRHGQVYPT